MQSIAFYIVSVTVYFYAMQALHNILHSQCNNFFLGNAVFYTSTYLILNLGNAILLYLYSIAFYTLGVQG